MKRIFALIVFLGGCSSKSGPDAEIVREDGKALSAVERMRESGDAAVALEEIRDFIASRPGSVYLRSARLEEARCLEDLGRSAEAEKIYRDVRDRSVDDRALAARAEWRMSFTAEAEGDHLRALAHALGAERLARSLPEHVAQAEIPARKAMLFYRLGRDEQGDKALRDAERGLRLLLSGSRAKLDDAWLARLYLEMGRSVATSVDADDFTRALRAHRTSQSYLLRALRSSDTETPPRALDILRSNYGGLWNAIMNVPLDTGAAAVALRARRARQIPMLADFLTVIEEAQAVRPAKEKSGTAEKEFFAALDELATKARGVLYADSETTVLTEESKVLNGLRRGTLPPSPSPDPNL